MHIRGREDGVTVAQSRRYDGLSFGCQNRLFEKHSQLKNFQ
jgi:hypothetical protein